MIDPADQNHSTNVFRVKESSHPMLPKKTLFALGKRRETSGGAEYTIYTVKDLGDKAFKVVSKVGNYEVPKSLDEKFGDLTGKDADPEAFAEIGDTAIQSAEAVRPEPKAAPELENMEAVEVPGHGDCFFQSVAYCILADSKFLDSVEDGVGPFGSDDDLKATKKERKPETVMKTSDAWIARMRERVAEHATLSMYQHAKEMALQTLDRKQYVALMHKAADAKKGDEMESGDVYKDGGDWYFVHGKKKDGSNKLPEQLESTPYPAIWNGSMPEKQWVREEKSDLELKKQDGTDGPGEIRGHELFLKKCDTFKNFKAFIRTQDYWADERAVQVLADRLEINILVNIVGVGVNASTGMHPDRSKTIILQRIGQHYNPMHKTGSPKFVFDTNGKIVSALAGKTGGADDDPVGEPAPVKKEQNESEDDGPAESKDSNAESKVSPVVESKNSGKDDSEHESEDSNAESKKPAEVDSDDETKPETVEPAINAAPANAAPANAEPKSSAVNEIVNEVPPKPEGQKAGKRSKKLRFSKNTSRKLKVHTDNMPVDIIHVSTHDH
jgi:hypothetical protein